MKFELTPLRVLLIIVVPILVAVFIRFVIIDHSAKSDGKTIAGADTDWPENTEVVTTWLLPDVLEEVSGIDWMDSTRFACVQDEVGKVFIYNIRLNTIERVIDFGPKGDYEGIAITPQAIYILEANGVIYEIGNYHKGTPAVRSYKTLLKKKDDSESLTYDKDNNRLLVAVKADKKGKRSKPIYGFDLRTKKMNAKPAYSIDLTHSIFDNETDEDKKGIRPSDIAIHPLTGDFYILEGTNPQLLIMGKDGAMKSLIDLKKSLFPQPEGICFDNRGTLFISNEGVKAEGNIMQVQLNEPF